MRKLSQKQFIEKSKEVHGDKYDYSKVVYKNSRSKVCIICPEHGEFWQVANFHLSGHGCPRCGGTGKLNTELFIKKSKEIHGDKYDYSKTIYTTADEKVCIICPEHGEFWQRAIAHLRGCGCPKCQGMYKTTNTIIDQFKEIHGDKYDYSKVEYTYSDYPVTIICKKHGEFRQTPAKHLIGHGCPLCGIEKRKEKQTLTTDEFIRRAKKIHGDKYDYSKVEYTSARDKIKIICPKHGEFLQFPNDHMDGHGCPKCGIIMSKAEEEISEYIKSLGIKNIIRNDRQILDGKEIDIYLPDVKIGIEYNGLKWHTESTGKDRYYHIDKLNECNKIGVKLIQIFEDEYINKKEIVLSKIRHFLKKDNNLLKIPARKCIIKEIERDDAIIFLDKYHIQGYGKCSISYGCFYQGFLVGVMSFLNENNGKWELVRFATDNHYLYQGVGGKLFKHFLNNNEASYVKTFADRRWTINEKENLYTKIGFKQDEILKPDYKYVNPDSPVQRMHKFSFRKRALHKKYDIPMKYTETQMCKELGFEKIWDCGLIRYVWKKD